jgi:hypothetical protein
LRCPDQKKIEASKWDLSCPQKSNGAIQPIKTNVAVQPTKMQRKGSPAHTGAKQQQLGYPAHMM